MKFTEEELEKLKKEKMEEIDRWLDNEFGISYTRYKNIIDELEKHICKEWYCFDNESVEHAVAKDILDKLKELKGE